MGSSNTLKHYPWQDHYPAGITWDIDIKPKSVDSMLDETALRYPNASAINFLGKKTSFASLSIAAIEFAGGLQYLGVKKGTKVALLLPNCPHFVIAYYAILKAGGCVVNCNPLYTEHELIDQLNDAEVEIIITLDLKQLFEKAEVLSKKTLVKKVIVGSFSSALPYQTKLLFKLFKSSTVSKNIPFDHQRMISFDSLLISRHTLEPVTINPEEDIAVLQYTGGTTGTPKGAMLTHANVYCNAVQTGCWFSGLEKGNEKMVGILPLFHVFAMTVVMNLSILEGCEMILYPRLDLKKLLADITKYKPTLMPGVPTLFSSICHFPNIDHFDLSSIKMCISGGAPLPLDTKAQFESMTGCSLIEGYGLTETSPVAAANPLFGKQKSGSIGLPLPATIIEIRDPETQNPVTQGEVGELCIAGPQVMKGYYHNQAQTDAVLKEGRVHTGDMGYIDQEGYVYIVDRLKDMIITSGFNVYPREIEELLYEHPDIKEVAVKGVASERQGEVIKAFIVLKESKTLAKQDILDFLKPQLAKYKLPSQIEFKQELPKTLIGKIDKKALH